MLLIYYWGYENKGDLQNCIYTKHYVCYCQYGQMISFVWIGDFQACVYVWEHLCDWHLKLILCWSNTVSFVYYYTSNCSHSYTIRWTLLLSVPNATMLSVNNRNVLEIFNLSSSQMFDFFSQILHKPLGWNDKFFCDCGKMQQIKDIYSLVLHWNSPYLDCSKYIFMLDVILCKS